MGEDFRIGVVPGVTPDKWVRVWHERVPATALRIVPVADPLAALADGADMVFARLPLDLSDPAAVHAIPLWEETQVVVAAKDHPVKAFESVTEADLAGEEEYPGWDDAVLDIVAAGHGIARMPQSVLRASGRRDVVGRPITDATPTRVALVWLRSSSGPLVDEFVGIVRGRTANSSRGEEAPPPVKPPAKPPRAPRPGRAAKPQQRRRGR